jgi:uncharacterized membrane protein YeaQ/YmgE (transglycosylase-associated protein family)
MGFVATILIGAALGALGGYSTLGRRPTYVWVLLAALGSFGALFTTYLGQDFGWNGPNEGAGPIGSVVGAFLVFAVTRCMVRHRLRRTAPQLVMRRNLSTSDVDRSSPLHLPRS